MWRPTSFRTPSGNTRLASICHPLSSHHDGRWSPRRRSPIPSSSAAEGRISCGVAFSCPVDEWDAIGEQEVGIGRSSALHPAIRLGRAPEFRLSRTLFQLRRQYAKSQPPLSVRERAGKLAIPFGTREETTDEFAHFAHPKTTPAWRLWYDFTTRALRRPGSDHIAP